MPLYEYQCEKCSHKFEKLQKFSDPLLKACPNCNEERLQKLVSKNSTFCLMGHGWSSPGMSVSKKH
ncbi:MAG: FmdB family zinc ribbon protein [Nitrososphaeraceae archaeon]